MTNYFCEEGAVCNNYQSAICLHCNRRLCILHIAQHNQVNSDNIRNLSHEIVLVTEHINNEYEKTRDIYQTVLVDLAEWRAKQVENITQAYNNYLQHVESQQEALNTLHYELIKKLDDDARKPLEVIQAQQTTGATVLTHIEQTIQIIRDQAAQIHWNVLTLPSVDIRCNLKDTSSTSSNDITLSSTHRPSKRFSINFKWPSLRYICLRKYRSFRRLVDMFSDVSHIVQSKHDLDDYVKNNAGFPLPVFVCSYLTAWYRCSQTEHKSIILKEHISTIMKHIPIDIDNYTALVGIHAFFYNHIISENKRQLMTFLLHFFVDHQCISAHQISHWYYNKDINAYTGFDGAKQMTAPFINSLWTDQFNSNVKKSNPMNSTELKHEKMFCIDETE
ncbi:unnamed protein product [Adineta steineri]|uniref:Uncharacterized protein n=1 Tax=Adineta steineri TaxID=433720 RepID=A0A819DBE3_9BILA|nr:unnamed protein product [Adineta steineri]